MPLARDLEQRLREASRPRAPRAGRRRCASRRARGSAGAGRARRRDASARNRRREKPRASSSATASASPSASAAVVLAVGARLSGQASCATPASRCTSASLRQRRARLAGDRDQLGAVALDTGQDRRAARRSRRSCEMAMNTSSRSIMPRSPWRASAGCTKNAGVPVEASVAAILRAMWPDLPMPLTTTRPRHSRISATAARKRSSMPLDERARPRRPRSRARVARARAPRLRRSETVP